MDRLVSIDRRERHDDTMFVGTLLKAAGVDMTSPEPEEAVARRMNALIDKMEELLAKRK